MIRAHSGLEPIIEDAEVGEIVFNVGDPDDVLRNGAHADRVCYVVREVDT